MSGKAIKTIEEYTASKPASQGTMIEQSRAIAEVQAMVIVAQQAPRKTARAVEDMREACQQRALAERAFFRFPRAGGTISGASVHLARELARCWGNIAYGVTELKRDDLNGVSEMQAYAWDVQTNTRNAVIFIVPHLRDKKGGPERLTDMRDIYENAANMGARRVRECIFAVLPEWFTREAQDLCRRTLEGRGDGGVPLPQQIAQATDAFGALGVTVDQLEAKLGVPRDRWTGPDIAQLQIIYGSIQRREISVQEEFPPRRTTAADIAPPAERDWFGELDTLGDDPAKIQKLYDDAVAAKAEEGVLAGIGQALNAALEGAQG